MTEDQIRRQAEYLAREHRDAEPEVERVYWFPDGEEVRLIETHRNIAATPDGLVVPFYFRPHPEKSLPVRSGVALVRPDEFGRLSLPDSWGDWSDAVELPADE